MTVCNQKWFFFNKLHNNDQQTQNPSRERLLSFGLAWTSLRGAADSPRFEPGSRRRLTGFRIALLALCVTVACGRTWGLTVYGNGAKITSGDATPSVTDDTDFGAVCIYENLTHTFTIVNDSGSTESVGSLYVDEDYVPAYFSYTAPAKPTLLPGQSTTFDVSFHPDTRVTRSARVVISTQGKAYVFTIRGTGGDVDLHVYDKGFELADGWPPLSFGNVVTGHSTTRTFTITNSGTCDLELRGVPYGTPAATSDEDAFEIIQQPASIVPPQAGTSFQVRFTPPDAGWVDGHVTICNNSGGDPFVIPVTGMGLNPEIEVQHDGTSILNRGHFSFGEVPLIGAKDTNVFTIGNSGRATLHLTGSPRVAVSGPNAADYSVAVQPASLVVTGAVSSFQLVFEPSAVGLRTATVSIVNDDANDDPFTFTVSGEGALPEIEVRGQATTITNGDVSPRGEDDTDFGPKRVDQGTVSHMFGLWNFGGAPLDLTGTPRVQISGTAATDFRVVADAPASLGPHNVSSFSIVFDPTSTGLRRATVGIPNTDSSANPFTFAIQGTGIMPEIMVVGNGLNIAEGDTTPRTADWTDFGSVAARVGSVTRTFTIRNTGDADLNLVGWPMVQLLNNDSFSVTEEPAASVSPGHETSFSITFAPVVTGLKTAIVRIRNDDSNENVFDFRIQGLSVSPAMLAKGNGRLIENGSTIASTDDDTDFRCVLTTSNRTQVLTIENSGTAALHLTGTPHVQISGADAADFSITMAPASTVATNASTSFAITLAPTVGGLRSAMISIPNDDPAKDPYTFAVRGMGAQWLTNNVPFTAAAATNAFGFALYDNDWAGLALAPAADAFDLTVYRDLDLVQALQTSSTLETGNAFVVLNGHSLVSGNEVRLAQMRGLYSSHYTIKSESSIPDLVVGNVYRGPSPRHQRTGGFLRSEPRGISRVSLQSDADGGNGGCGRVRLRTAP